MNTSVSYSTTRDIESQQIQAVRQSIGWDPETTEIWLKSLQQAIAVVSAWDGDKLVGICFLSGLPLTGMVSDFTVHADYQKQGIGHEIFKRVLEATSGMQNVSLFCDPKQQGLPEFYGRFGFVATSAGMRLQR